MTDNASMSPLFSAIANEIRAMRAARRERKRLRSELALYTNPADRHELEAILDRYPLEETAEIRSLLGNWRSPAAR